MIFSLLTLALSAFAQCPGSLPTGIECVGTGTTKQISAFSSCAKVTNSHGSAKALMVPIGNSTDWSTFRTKPPAGVTIAACPPTVIFLVNGSSWTVPADWNNSNNSIECIGSGGGGQAGSFTGGGGGGGGYAKIVNRTLTPGASVSYAVGGGGAPANDGTPVWFISTSTLYCDYGRAGTTAAGGAGGSANIGSTVFGGGAGAKVGGGGAAGPNGAGKPGGASNGGAGDNGLGGAGGTGVFAASATAGSGVSGSEYTSTLGTTTGPGGGGGGGTGASSVGGNGGYPGGAGGGAGNSGTGGFGSSGLIIITYTP